MSRFIFLLIPAVLLGRGFILPPDWEPEKTHYLIVAKGDTIGTILHIIDTATVEDVPIYNLKSIIHAAYGEIESFDTTIVTVKRENLKPILSKRIQLIRKERTEVTSYYGDKKAILILKSEYGEKKLTFDIHGDVYDNGELVFLLRTFNFKPNNSYNITNIAPIAGKLRKMNIRFAGEREIKLRRNKVSVYHLELRMAGRKMDIFLEKIPPHKMVKYEDPNTGVLYILR